MWKRHALSLFTVTSAVATLILSGCGGSNILAPRPVGNFTNANLSGQYAFLFSGTNAGGTFSMAGSLQADGNGNFTSGVMDINSPGTTVGVQTNVSVTGTYTVHADGRGSGTITTPIAALGNNGAMGIDFVLLSNQHGFIVRFDQGATASGSLDQQTSSAFNLAALAGNLVFNVGGADIALAQAPEASAGVFSVDASGNISSGTQDTNDSGNNSVSTLAIPAQTGAMTAPSTGNGRGTVVVNGRNFAFYVIDGNHIKMIETDAATLLAGDAFRQGSASISGSFAFTTSGAAGPAGALTPFAAGGILNTDGNGNIVNTSIEDTNTGVVNANLNVNLSGTYAVAANGRGTMSLNGGTINYAIYPSQNGIQMLRIDPAVMASGTALQQTGPFSNSTISGRFGGNFTGADVVAGSEFDAVTQFTADGNGKITGTIDLNDIGVSGINSGLALSGNYALDSTGRSSSVGVLNAAGGNARTLNVIFYAVSSSRTLFIEVDQAVAVGAIVQQQ